MLLQYLDESDHSTTSLHNVSPLSNRLNTFHRGGSGTKATWDSDSMSEDKVTLDSTLVLKRAIQQAIKKSHMEGEVKSTLRLIVMKLPFKFFHCFMCGSQFRRNPMALQKMQIEMVSQIRQAESNIRETVNSVTRNQQSNLVAKLNYYLENRSNVCEFCLNREFNL